MRGFVDGLIYIGLWIGLSVLGGVTAWYLHVAVLALFALLIDSPLRPYGWSVGTLAAVSRMSLLVLGSGYLIFVTWLERALRVGQREGRMWRLTGQLVLVLAAIWGAAYLYLLW